MGAVSGVATAGIGNIFNGIGGAATNSFGAKVLNEVGRAAAHGVVQGGLSELQGGSFKNGFASGTLSSVATSGFKVVGGNFADSKLGGISFGALSGGVGAELTGGDFWRGAGIGATVTLLNHLAHDGIEKIQNEKAKKLAKKLRLSEEELNEILSKPMLDPYTKKLLDMSKEELIQEYNTKLKELKIIHKKIMSNNKELMKEYKQIRYNQIRTLTRIGIRSCFFLYPVSIPDELIDAYIPPID